MLRAALVLGATACTPHPSSGEPRAEANKPEVGVEGGVEAGVEAAAGGGPADAAVASATPAVPDPSFDDIVAVLFADRSSSAEVVTACPSSLAGDSRLRCVFDERYRGDAKAASLAHELWVKWRIVAGVEAAHTMDGGYRGMIRIEPAVPIGADRKHLEWVADAFRDFDRFFDELAKARGPAPGRAAGPAYRFHPITLRFMRSVGAHTPAAYAEGWTVAYNFNGSLNTSADAVRETMFHEIFHLNDAAHGGWSQRALGSVFDFVVKRCGTAIPCLQPYSPNETIVRGGTYYSFQPGNGVMEYAAELALRYYREQRAMLRALPGAKAKPFKCGPPENAKAWALLRDELFDGVDVVPPCP